MPSIEQRQAPDTNEKIQISKSEESRDVEQQKLETTKEQLQKELVTIYWDQGQDIFQKKG